MAKSRSYVSTEQFVFASAVSGAYASAAVALLFLGLDTIRGTPLLTPSLMGSVFLLGEAPTSALAIRLDMVAVYSLVHFVAFAGLGALTTFLYVRWDTMQRHPVVPAGFVMAFLMLTAVSVELVVAPGLLSAVGVGAITVGNAAAAGVMGWFIHSAVDPQPRALTVFSGSGASRQGS